jgi:hypothetical protein
VNEPNEATDGRSDETSEPAHRVKGEAHDGPIPAKALLRIVIIGLPVMIVAWYFLRWMKGDLR